MVQKIATLEQRVDGKIRDVKRSFDVNYQTEQRPWLMVGLAAAAGYLLSGLVLGPPRPRPKVVLPSDWRPQASSAQQQRAGITTSLMGMLSGVVTATAVGLAREYATKWIFKQDRPEQHPAAEPTQDRRFQ
jgi:hypothetical protein